MFISSTTYCQEEIAAISVTGNFSQGAIDSTLLVRYPTLQKQGDRNWHQFPEFATSQQHSQTHGSQRILAMDAKGSLSQNKYLNSIDQTAVPDVEWVHDEQENDSLKGSLERVPEDEYDEQ